MGRYEEALLGTLAQFLLSWPTGPKFTLVEMGTCRCKNAVRMINLASKHRFKPVYWGFDLFENLTKEISARELNIKKPISMDQAYEILRRDTLGEIHLRRGDSVKTLPRAIPEIGRIDFAFIDGGHLPETIESDWRHISEALDGIAVFDDYYHTVITHGCKLLIDGLKPPWKSQLLDPVENYPMTGNMQMVRVWKNQPS